MSLDSPRISLGQTRIEPLKLFGFDGVSLVMGWLFVAVAAAAARDVIIPRELGTTRRIDTVAQLLVTVDILATAIASVLKNAIYSR